MTFNLTTSNKYNTVSLLYFISLSGLFLGDYIFSSALFISVSVFITWNWYQFMDTA